MKSVNPAVTANLNTRLFAIQEKEFLANNIQFFTDFKALVEKYEGKTIRHFTDAFMAEAKAKNIPLYYDNEYGVDTDIFNWLPEAQVVDGVAPKGSITMLKKNTTEGEMVKTALKLPLSQAIEKMTTELRAGYFNEKLRWLVIYLTDTKDGIPLELVCSRISDGKLYLYVYEVHPDDVWYVDDGKQVGFLSSNES